MKNRFLLFSTISALLAALSPGLLAQTKSTVFNTDHDIAALAGGCKSCHLPHQQSAKGETLLWAQNFTTKTDFGVYSSPTMNTAAVEVGAAYGPTNPPNGAKSYTVLCLSCHDGQTTPSVIGAGDEHAIGNASSDGLRNDHPVNLAYNATADPGLEPLATVQATAVKLFSDGANATVQCASCHDVHNNTNGTFLRVATSSTKAGLCTVCHK